MPRPETGFEGDAPWGEPLRLPPGAPVHVVVGSPWRDALADVRGENRRLRAQWRVPAGAAEGDVALLVVEARGRAVIGVTTLRQLTRGLVPGRASQLLPLGVSTVGVARRLGRYPLGRVGTLSAATAAAVLGAVTDEQVHPTPWVLADDGPCTEPRTSWVPRRHYRLECAVCGTEQEQTAHPAAVAGFDEHVVRDDDGDLCDGMGSLTVCAACHAVLHSPLGPSVEELVFAHREQCPNPTCGVRRTWVWAHGMPAGPPPLGVHLGGCTVDVFSLPLSCDACGLAWGYEEHGERVRSATLPTSLRVFDPVEWRMREILRG